MVQVSGHFAPGETVEVFPVVDLLPQGKPIKTVKAKADGSVDVKGLDPGSYFLEGGKRVRIDVHPEVVAETVEAPETLTDDEIRERLAQTRPAEPVVEATLGARTTADKPRRRPAPKRRAAKPRAAAPVAEAPKPKRRLLGRKSK